MFNLTGLVLHQGRLPAAAPAYNVARERYELMAAVRSCRDGHEEVGWTGPPNSCCWMCDRPWSTA